MAFQLMSTAFNHEGQPPDLYTCKGKNVSHPLSWQNPPEAIESFALVAEDTDTPIGTMSHWVIYNIQADRNELEEAVHPHERFPDGTIQGKNRPYVVLF